MLICLLLNFSSPTYAHPGRLDSNGGHYNRKTGEYHYHDGLGSNSLSSSSISKEKDYTYKYTESQTKSNNDNNSTSSPQKKNTWLSDLIAILVAFCWFIIPLVFGFIEFIKDKLNTKKANVSDKIRNLNSLPNQAVAKLQKKNNEDSTDTKSSYYQCPLCGENLIIKNGRYGAFIGCSNYPKCKYTKSLNKKNK